MLSCNSCPFSTTILVFFHMCPLLKEKNMKENQVAVRFPAFRSAQVMRAKWACPAGMWGLRRHSCCSMRGRDSGNWSLSTSDTPQASHCLLFLKDRGLGLYIGAESALSDITGTTWTAQVWKGWSWTDVVITWTLGGTLILWGWFYVLKLVS